MNPLRFKAKPWRPMPKEGSWTFGTLPPKVHAALGGAKGRIPIRLSVNGHVFQTSVTRYAGEHHFMFNGVMREATGAWAAFDRMAYSHKREFVGAIEEAKRPETRTRRIIGCVQTVLARGETKTKAGAKVSARAKTSRQ